MKYQLFGREDPIFFLSHILPALVLLVPFAAAFYKTLKHFDAKPLKWQAKYYLKLALPVIAVLLVFILMFLKPYFIWLKLID